MLKFWNEFLSLWKKGINYPQTIISMKLTKFTVLYTATMKGGKRLLRKSWCELACNAVTSFDKKVTKCPVGTKIATSGRSPDEF